MDKELDRLVDLLADHSTVVLSGARLSRELGIPRSTLQEHIEVLRRYGVKVAGHRGRGFVLKAMPDILTSSVIQRAARGTQFGARVHHFYTIGSTMDAAARAAQGGEPHGAIFIAEEQTAGRGRLGRAWHSERGAGIWSSILLRPTLPAARAPVLTLISGLAIADAVLELTGQTPDLRWPNDVLIGPKKCSGILPEMTAEGERIKHVIMGIGLNVNHRRFPPELADEATSLALAAGRRFSRAEALAVMLRALDRRFRRLPDSGVEPVLEEFAARSSFARDRKISVETETETITAITEGLDGCGFLRLRRSDTGAVEPVLAGTVRATS